MKSQRFPRPLTVGSAFLASVALLGATAEAQITSTWTGGGSTNNWNEAANWTGGVPTSSDSTVLVFSGSTRTTSNNNLTGSFNIGQLQFGAGAAAFTLSGDMIGFQPYLGSQTQQIIQASPNTQTISTTQISFRSGANSQISLDGGDLVINTNVFIDVPNNSGIVRQFTITGSDSTRRTVTLAGDVSKFSEGGSAQDPDMVIRGNKRALVTGSLTFGSGNDDAVFVEDGVLQFSGAGTMTAGRPAIGATSGSANAAVWLDTPGTSFAQQLQLVNGSSGRRTIGGLNTSGTVTFSGELVGNAGDYDLAAATGGTVNFAGTRSANATLHVNRPDGATTFGGTVVLSGGNAAVDKGFNIYGGVLEFGDFPGVMGDGTNFIEFNAASGNSGTFRYSGGSFTTTRRLWIDNPGITRAAVDVSGAGTTLTWNPSDGTRSTNLTKTGAGTLVFGGGITGGDVAVEAGTLILTGSNSYSGGTTVSGGTLEVSAGGSQGGSPSALGTGTVAIAAGGRVAYWLSLSGADTITNAFSLSGGTLHTTDGSNTYSGQFTLASGTSTISAQYEDTITLSGGLSGSGNVLFTQSGGTGSYNAPTYVLSGTGANTGTLRVDGTSNGSPTKLQMANVNALQSATLDLATADVGGVEFTVGGANTYALGGLQGSRNLALGSNSVSIGGNNQSTTYSGGLSGTGSVTKVGSGTLRLSGTNNTSAGTTVSAGTLQVDGSIAGPLTVAAAGTLSGTGTVGGTAGISGTHSPGNSPGIQTFSGDLTYNTGAVVNWELIANSSGSPGTNFDQIAVGGNLSFAGSTTLALSFNASGSSVVWADPFWDINRSWMIYDLSSGSAGSLLNLAIGGSLLDSLGNSLSPTARGAFTTAVVGQDVMLEFTAVPEPSTCALALAALAGGSWMTRGRRRPS